MAHQLSKTIGETINNINMQNAIHVDEEATQIISTVDENGQIIDLGTLQQLYQFGYITDSNGTVICKLQTDDGQKYQENSAAEDTYCNEALDVPFKYVETMNNIQMQSSIHVDEEPTQIISTVVANGQIIELGTLQQLYQFGYITDSKRTVFHEPQDAEQEYEDISSAEDTDSNEALVIPSTASYNLPSQTANLLNAYDIEELINSTILRNDEVIVQPTYNLTTKITDESTAPIISREDNIYRCLLCTNKFFRLEAKEVIAHFHDTHDEYLYICDICGDFFLEHDQFQAHVIDHLNNSDDKAWACEICSKKYSKKNLLDDHNNTHTGHRPYSYGVCSKNFTSKNKIKIHEKTHKDRPKSFECTTCSKSFMSQEHLTQHELTHNGVKDISCKQCHKKFRSESYLRKHSVVHTGLKAFKCNTCAKAFARKGDLKDHERTHTGEKPYECEICDSGFIQRSSLQSHKRTAHFNNTGYKCKVCGKGCQTKRMLENHIKAVHMGDKPLKCDPAALKYHSIVVHKHQKEFSTDGAAVEFTPTASQLSHNTLMEGPSETVSTFDLTQVYSTDMLNSIEGTLVRLKEGEILESTGEVSHISFNGHNLQ